VDRADPLSYLSAGHTGSQGFRNANPIVRSMTRFILRIANPRMLCTFRGRHGVCCQAMGSLIAGFYTRQNGPHRRSLERLTSVVNASVQGQGAHRAISIAAVIGTNTVQGVEISFGCVDSAGRRPAATTAHTNPTPTRRVTPIARTLTRLLGAWPQRIWVLAAS
jgi:hypothetical protein